VKASYLILFTSVTGCAASHGVRPIGEGNAALTASVGGPMARLFGTVVPIPMSSVGFRYGLSDRSDLHASVNTTALGLFGVVGLDAGASTMLVPPSGAVPAVVVDGHLLLAAGGTGDGLSARAYGEAELLASWDFSEREHLAYVGWDTFIQPYKLGGRDDALYPETTRLIMGPIIGIRPTLSRRLALPVQATWLNPWTDTEPLTAVYPAPGGRGALQVELGLLVRLGALQ
jgi:hypothetical protein